MPSLTDAEFWHLTPKQLGALFREWNRINSAEPDAARQQIQSSGLPPANTWQDMLELAKLTTKTMRGKVADGI